MAFLLLIIQIQGWSSIYTNMLTSYTTLLEARRRTFSLSMSPFLFLQSVSTCPLSTIIWLSASNTRKISRCGKVKGVTKKEPVGASSLAITLLFSSGGHVPWLLCLSLSIEKVEAGFFLIGVCSAPSHMEKIKSFYLVGRLKDSVATDSNKDVCCCPEIGQGI